MPYDIEVKNIHDEWECVETFRDLRALQRYVNRHLFDYSHGEYRLVHRIISNNVNYRFVYDEVVVGVNE